MGQRRFQGKGALMGRERIFVGEHEARFLGVVLGDGAVGTTRDGARGGDGPLGKQNVALL